jgi:NAD(P)-dependent dehydrogenase (short-subunit alcohol dehydrogenase family)
MQEGSRFRSEPNLIPHNGIRANAVMPGLMNTPLSFQPISGQYENAEEMVKARDAACPMGRMGTAWNMAKAALFLASDAAEYITGVSLPVDGGLTCRIASGGSLQRSRAGASISAESLCSSA